MNAYLKRKIINIIPWLDMDRKLYKLYKKSYNFYKKDNNLKASYYRYKIIKKYNCIIAPSAKIGDDVVFPHPLGIVIGSDVEIGNNVTIYQHVTIGRKEIHNANYPKIGNNVIIYAGAQIIGGIEIGDNCIVGANAVVTHDIPDNCVAVGVPAKIIEKK